MSNVQSFRIIFWKYEDVLNRGVSRLWAVICFCWKALSWIFDLAPKWSVIRQKGGFQNGSFKKTKHTKFSEKRTFHTPWYAHVHSYHLIRTHTFKVKNKKMLGGCHQVRDLGRERGLAYSFLNIENSALNLDIITLIVSIYGLNENLRASTRKNSRIFTSRAFLWCVIDKMFIEVPSFQETLPTLKSF